MAGRSTLTETFARAEDHYFNGRLKEAAALCKEILDADPDFAHGYYLMGALFKTTGNFENAVKFSDMAIERQPKVASFHLQRGHSLLCLGRSEEAEPSLKRAVSLDEKSAVALLLLGNIAMKRQDYAEAAQLFKRAAAIEEIAEVYEHLGLCYQIQGRLDEAEQAFSRLIALYPDHAAAHLHMGRLFYERGDIPTAESYFEKAAALNPASHDALIFLVKARDALGKTVEAAEIGLKALALKPPTVGPYLYVATLMMKLSNYPLALEAYRGALAIDPEHSVAVKGYTNMLIQTNQIKEALIYIDKQLAKNPDDVAMNYFKAAFTGQNLETAPPEYVAKLFDEYADRFEQHLQSNLSYNTPKLLANAVMASLAAAGMPRNNLSLLDLGCGTGLGAEALRDVTGFRVGVDLSPRMIEKAKEKHLYNDTAVGDITEYLQRSPRLFDLVIAVDVLVYIGKLDAVFQSAAGALAPGGLFAFSVEGGDDSPPFVLRVTARYGHAKSYLESLAERFGYDVLHMEPAIIRHEKDVPLQGYIAVFRKRVAH